MKHKLRFIIAASCLFAACDKYLDLKPDKKLAVPVTLQDAVALLDYTYLNTYSALGEAAADNYYMTATDWAGLTAVRDRNIYIWQNDANDGDGGIWSGRYNIVFTANEVLDILEGYEAKKSEQAEWTRTYGSGFFLRAYATFDVLQHFSKPYDKASAATDPGVPIRLSPDVNEKSVRASVQQCYEQIIADLKQAAALLPVSTSIATRPSKAAAYAALANVYLSMEEYGKAELYADSALQINKDLIDYNSISTTAAVPIARYNKETIFYSTGGSTQLTTARAKIDNALYASYDANDLRKTIFFKQNADKSYAFKGSYDGQNSSNIFLGLTTAEIFLVRAECYARAGKTADALKDLNELMINRWKMGAFVPFTAASADDALGLILQERRKELVMRGRRWFDLRRLNKDSRFAVTLKRQLGSDIYELAPNDKQYVFPIPQVVIDYSGISQN